MWINLNDLMTPMPADFVTESRAGKPGSYFLWGSERSGFQHLYLYFVGVEGEAELVAQVTTGDWNVESVDKLDVANNRVRRRQHAPHTNAWMDVVQLTTRGGCPLCCVGQVFVSGTGPGKKALGRYLYQVSLDGEHCRCLTTVDGM